MRNICKIIAFCLVFVVIFGQIQNALSMDWKKQSDTAPIFAGFEALDKDSIDVFFFGSSLVEQGVSPLRIYEINHIVGYNLALPAMSFEPGYYILKNAFQTQKPKVVVLEAASVFSGKGLDAVWRYSLGILPMGKNKYDMAKEYCEKMNEDIASCLIPIMYYKYRWAELNRGDFQSEKPRLYYSAGFYPVSTVSPSTVTPDLLQYTIDDMKLRNNLKIKYRNSEKIETDSRIQILYDSNVIDEKRINSIKKLKALCEDNGAQLVMVNIPSIRLPQRSVNKVWTKENAETAKKVASELGIPFYDLMYDYDIIDFTGDTCDGGVHLNFRGGEKISDVLADILAEYIGANAGPNEVYDQMLEKYREVRTIAMLQSTMDFSEYLQRLADHAGDWTIYISCSNEFTRYLSEQDKSFMTEKLHTKLIDDGNYQDSYLAVIDKGDVLYEAVSNQRITEQLTVNGESVNLVSSGWLSGPLASIEINETEYAINGSGLNIVVYDNKSSIVIDSVCFDTFQESKPATRNWSAVNGYLRAYEAHISATN